MKKSKNRNQGGQATAEMAVAIVTIMAIMSGFLLIAQLGRTGIRSILEARRLADINSYNGISLSPGSSIRHWETGDDLMEMSADDTAVAFTNDEPELFKSQLSNGSFNLASDISGMAIENFATDLTSDFIFLEGADLTSGESSESIDLNDASRFLYGGNTLFGTSSIDIDNTVYMPIISE